MNPITRAAQCAALVAIAPLAAQVGNEVVFVGSSTSGSTDQHAFVESATGLILGTGGVTYTDNVTAAVWADTGRNLYVSQSLMNQVSRAAWDGASASWSTFYPAPGACYGLGFDRGRKLLWTLTGSSGSNRELHGIDADPSSPGYGLPVANTASLSGVSRERWRLSFSGNLAAVPHAFVAGGALDLVDLAQGSPTYLQVIASAQVTAASGFAIASDCAISIDDAYAYLLWTGIGAAGLGVWDIAAGAWLDFSPAPGQQDFAIQLAVPNRMALSLDRSFAIISGQGGGGWVLRIDFDYTTPANTTAAQFPLTGLVPNCNAVSLSPDQSRVAVSATAVNLQAPSQLLILDATTGVPLQTTMLANMWNVYTTAWQDGSPLGSYATFGSGCPAALGIPWLAPASGSRPALGGTFTLELGNLPFGIGVVSTGLSTVLTSAGLPLPLPLGPIGMPGCTLLADPLVLGVVVAPGSTAQWAWSIANLPQLFGLAFANQGFALDPAANSFGFAASNAGIGTFGL